MTDEMPAWANYTPPTGEKLAELRAAVTAYLGLADALKRLHPWVERVVTEAGGELPPEKVDRWSNWPEGDTSIRGAAYAASGGLLNDWQYEHGPFGSTADEMALLLRRITEAK